MCFQLVWVGIDHDLPVPSAKGLWNARSGHAGDLVTNGILRQIAEFRLIQSFTLERHQTHGKTGSVKLQYDGGQSAWGRRRRFAIARFEMLVTAESAFVPG